MAYFVYILLCADESYYVGYCTDLDTRVRAHQAGTGAYYTRKHAPVKLVYSEQFQTEAEAVRRELQLKGWSRAKKRALIEGDLANLKILSRRRSSRH